MMPLNKPLDPLDRASRDFLLRNQASNDEPRATQARAGGAHEELQVAYAWDLAGMLSDEADIRQLRTEALTAPDIRSRPARGRRWAIAGAAAAAAAGGAALFLSGIPAAFAPGSSLAPDPQFAARSETTASAPVRRVVTLPDGSQVMLDARSSIRTAFSSRERRVILSTGRGYFTVRHEARPFIVSAGAGEIIDLGTRFVVDNGGAGTSVSLVEGKVAVRATPTARAVDLRPGEMVSYARGSGLSAVHAAKGDPLDWTSGKLTFDDVALAQAVSTMSRYTVHPIVLGDDLKARDRRVTGVFLIGSSENFAETLASALDLKVVQRNDGVRQLEPK